MPRRILLDRHGEPHEFVCFARPTFGEFADTKVAESERSALPDRIRDLAAQIVEADDTEALNLAREIAKLIGTNDKMPKRPAKVAPSDEDLAKPPLVELSRGGHGRVQPFGQWVDDAILNKS
jgi:hypothetical protein